jgi:hypothetical protein
LFLQTVIVFLIVSACAVYAAWTLMPQGLRNILAKGLLGVWAAEGKFPMPSLEV